MIPMKAQAVTLSNLLKPKPVYLSGVQLACLGQISFQSALHSKSSQNRDRFPNYERSNDYTSSYGQKDKFRRQKPIRFNVDNASDQAKRALADIVQRVRELSPNLRVQTFNDETKQLRTASLPQIVNKLSFREEGLQLSYTKDGSLPVIRVVKLQEMLRAYSAKLAKAKEAELLEIGNAAAMRSAKQKREADRKKNALKVVAISWAISPSDLQNQKFNDIKKRVKQEKNFVIYLGDKSSLGQTRNAEKEGLLGSLSGADTISRVDGNLEIEIFRREKLIDLVKGMLVELECPFEESGSVTARAAFNCTPRKVSQNATASKTTSSSEHEEREARRKRRLEKEKKEKEQKEKIEGEDLDSLYSFKLDD